MLTMVYKVLYDLFINEYLPELIFPHFPLAHPLTVTLSSSCFPYHAKYISTSWSPLCSYPSLRYTNSHLLTSFQPWSKSLLNLKNIPIPTKNSYSPSFHALFCCMAPPIFLTNIFTLLYSFCYCPSPTIEWKLYEDKPFDLFYICLEQNKCLIHICWINRWMCQCKREETFRKWKCLA